MPDPGDVAAQRHDLAATLGSQWCGAYPVAMGESSDFWAVGFALT